MSDNYIKVTVTGNKSKSVSVKSTELKNQITAGADMSIYYSNKAKEWAISDKLVDNEDYSSKYHANLAKSYTEEGALQIAEITTLREQTLADIETEKQNVIDMGTDQINQVTTISNTAISDIEISKTNALSDIDSAKTIVLEDISTQETQTINNIKETADVELDKIVGAGIDTRANIDLSNLSEVGEKHFLGKSQITNCITEIPQRIKLELNDGTLTLKAGSVIIVPYGTTDRTSEFPVGSTFIHENFKVVDTQFVDGKFIVWVEVKSNISTVETYNGSALLRLMIVNFQNNELCRCGSNVSSGQTAPSSSSISVTWYDTTNNYCKYFLSATETVDGSFPIGEIEISTGYSAISQTFNGFGYIGSTYWVDKGVKGLIANGRNADRSCKNIEWTQTKFQTYTFKSTHNYTTAHMAYGDNYNRIDYMLKDGTNWNFDENENIYKYGETRHPYAWIDLGTCTVTAGVISNFKPKQPFKAVDYSDLGNIYTTTKATTTSSASASRPAVIVQNYKNGTSWYRVWSDGWIEQGGRTSARSANGDQTITYSKAFSDTNYTIIISNMTNLQTNESGVIHTMTKSNCKVYAWSGRQTSWYACGY